MNRSTIVSNTLNKIWYKYLNSADAQAEVDNMLSLKLLNVGSSDKKFEEMDGVGDFGSLVEKTEGTDIAEYSLIPLRDVRVEHKTFSGGVTVTLEAMEDDNQNIYSDKCIKQLKRAANATVEYSGANLFENGFSTDYTQATGGFMGGGTDNGDGAALFSASHTYANGETWSNLASGNPSLTLTSLNAARSAIMAQKSLSGNYQLMNKINKLVHSQYNWMNVSQILNSTLVPDSANNAINPYASSKIEAVEWPLLDTYTQGWYLLCEEHYLYHWWRKQAEIMAPFTKQNGDMFYAIRERFSNGWFDANGTYASTGANA